MSISSYKTCPGDVGGGYDTMRRYPAYPLINMNGFEYAFIIGSNNIKIFPEHLSHSDFFYSTKSSNVKEI